MQNLLLIHKKNDLYFVKCNETGAIVKFDENHYHKLLNKDNDIISDLNKIGFFSKSCNDVESLSLFIMMNNTCNLNCSYCFEHDKKNIYFNDTNIEEFIKKLHRFVNDCKIKSLDITFTGGEPLLQYKNLMIMTESIVKLCKECLVELSFSVITNGTVITKQMISFFEKYNFSIQITLDGNKDRHDKIRHFFDKSGSFDIIYSKLREISLLSKLYVSIRINVNTPCFDEYKQLLEKLYNDFPNYKIYIDFLDVPLNSNLYIGLEKKEQFFK